MLKPRFDPFRFSRAVYPSQDQRRRLIEEAAYRRSQARGFSSGQEVNDWLAAEAEIDFELSCRSLGINH